MVESSSSDNDILRKPFRLTFKTEGKERTPYIVDIDTDIESVLILIHTFLNLTKTNQDMKGLMSVFGAGFTKFMLGGGPSNPLFNGILGAFSSMKRPPQSQQPTDKVNVNVSEANVQDIDEVMKTIEGLLGAGVSKSAKSKFDDLFKDDKADPTEDVKKHKEDSSS